MIKTALGLLPFIWVGLFLCLMAFVASQTVPSVLFDEWVYSNAAIWDPAGVPTASYLFTWIYSITGLAPAPYHYFVGQLLNMVFWFIQFVFLYFSARLILERGRSLVVALLVSLYSMSGWVYVFMPEMMFSALLVGGLYFLFATLIRRFDIWSLHLSAVLVGLSSAVKVHSLFVLPALLILVYFSYLVFEKRLWLRIVGSLMFVIEVVAVKLMVGFLVAGAAGLTLLGQYQSSVDRFFRAFMTPAGEADSSPGLSGPSGGIYLGVQAPSAQSVDWDLVTFFGLLAQAGANFSFITLIAFAWLFAVPFIYTVGLTGDHKPASVLFSASFLVLINLGLLAVVFSVFATLSGDDHSNRVLFRYVEFIFLVVSVFGAGLMLVGDKRSERSKLRRFRYLVPLAVFLAALLGGQGTVRANYADSTFTPVLGQPFFWIPIVLVTLTAVMLVGFNVKPNLQKTLSWVILGSYSVVGLGTHLDIWTGSNRDALAGSEQTSYILSNLEVESDDIFLISSSPQVSGRIATLSKLPNLRYGISLGTNPLRSDDLPTSEHIIASEGTFFDLDESRLSVIHSRVGFEHFMSTEDNSALRDTLVIDSNLLDSDLKYYSQGVLYSATGKETLTLNDTFTNGNQLDICLTMPQDITARVVEIGASGKKVQIEIPTGAHERPFCTSLTSGAGLDADEITIQSNVLTNELESGEMLSEVAFGISTLEVK